MPRSLFVPLFFICLCVDVADSEDRRKKAVVNANFPLASDDALEEEFDSIKESEEADSDDLDAMLDALKEHDFFQDEEDYKEMKALWGYIRKNPDGPTNEVQEEALQMFAARLEALKEGTKYSKNEYIRNLKMWDDPTIGEGFAGVRLPVEVKTDVVTEDAQSETDDEVETKEETADALTATSAEVPYEKEEQEKRWREWRRFLRSTGFPPLVDLLLVLSSLLILFWLAMLIWRKLFSTTSSCEDFSTPPSTSASPLPPKRSFA